MAAASVKYKNKQVCQFASDITKLLIMTKVIIIQKVYKQLVTVQFFQAIGELNQNTHQRIVIHGINKKY